MTKEKQTKPAKDQFLKDVKNELGELLWEVLKDYNEEETMAVLDQLYPSVEVWVKQSFINGVEAGGKREWIKNQKKAQKQIARPERSRREDAVERQAEKDRQDNSRY